MKSNHGLPWIVMTGETQISPSEVQHSFWNCILEIEENPPPLQFQEIFTVQSLFCIFSNKPMKYPCSPTIQSTRNQEQLKLLVKIKAVVLKNCLILLQLLNMRISKYTAMRYSSRI